MARRSHYQLRVSNGCLELVCDTCDVPLQAWLDDEPIVLGDVVSVANEHDRSEHRE